MNIEYWPKLSNDTVTKAPQSVKDRVDSMLKDWRFTKKERAEISAVLDEMKKSKDHIIQQTINNLKDFAIKEWYIWFKAKLDKAVLNTPAKIIPVIAKSDETIINSTWVVDKWNTPQLRSFTNLGVDTQITDINNSCSVDLSPEELLKNEILKWWLWIDNNEVKKGWLDLSTNDIIQDISWGKASLYTEYSYNVNEKVTKKSLLQQWISSTWQYKYRF